MAISFCQSHNIHVTMAEGYAPLECEMVKLLTPGSPSFFVLNTDTCWNSTSVIVKLVHTNSRISFFSYSLLIWGFRRNMKGRYNKFQEIWNKYFWIQSSVVRITLTIFFFFFGKKQQKFHYKKNKQNLHLKWRCVIILTVFLKLNRVSL